MNKNPAEFERSNSNNNNRPFSVRTLLNSFIALQDTSNANNDINCIIIKGYFFDELNNIIIKFRNIFFYNIHIYNGR